MVSLLLSACGPSTCEQSPAAERAACLEEACGHGSGLGYEMCLAQQLAPLREVEDVQRIAVRMSDVVLRDTAILSWSETKPYLTVTQAQAICSLLLAEGDKLACTRNATTPHLSPSR